MENKRLPLSCSVCEHCTPDFDGSKPDNQQTDTSWCAVDNHTIENPKISPPRKCPLFKPTEAEIKDFQKRYGGGKIKTK